MTARGPLVLAFGGNALLPDPTHPAEQAARARGLARAVLHLLPRYPGVVLVHGNGPQVGMILLRVEATRDRLPPEPLDVLVAETQGSVGILLARALQNALVEEEAVEIPVTSVLTQVLVEADDPAFTRPTKPIGPAYEAVQAERHREMHGWQLAPEPSGGLRRVVASPRPLEVIELPSIAAAAAAGAVVIAGGGGGVPVVRGSDGLLEGVEAVVDKDRTAALLACSLRAPDFVILTGVPHVSTGFGTPEERPLARVTLAEARRLLAAGEFPRGSMGPKVEAVCDYVEATGGEALITDTAQLARALDGEGGTWVVAGDAAGESAG